MHEDYLDFLLNNQPLNDVRLRMWERKYPGCSDDFGEIFNTQLPSPQEVARWKTSWIESTPHKYYLGEERVDLLLSSEMKSKIHDTCYEAGIHPYFWEFWKEQRDEYIDRDDDHMPEIVTVLIPYVSFYKGEHLIMFKLRWGL